MTEFQDGPGNGGSGLDGSSTDRIIEGFARINEKVDAMRNQRLNDPDSLGDKAVKFALPSIAGFVAGKLFTLVWNKFVARKRPSDGTGELGDGRRRTSTESLFMSILFDRHCPPPWEPRSRNSPIAAPKPSSLAVTVANPTDNRLASSSALSPCIFYAHQPVLRL